MRSIIKIKDFLTRNQRLIPDIRENDKTPSWDGEIIVYKSDSIAKKDIEGRVPVQIKGSVQKDLSQYTIKYTLDCSDLRNYLSSNGAIIFVIYMKDYDECKIYYNALLPFDLNKLIKTMGEQKTKTIELQEFPKDDPIEVVNIFLNFIKDQKLQGGTVDQRVLSLRNIKELGLETDGFYFGYRGIGLNDFTDVINYSLTHSTYIYAQPKGFNVKVPIDKIEVDQILSDIPAPITVDDKIFYSSYKVIHEIGKQVLNIGKSITFDINTGKFNYKPLGKLSERVKDLKFVIALLKNKNIKINGVIFSADSIKGNNLENLKNQEEYLRGLEEIQSVLNISGVKKDLEMDKLSKKELNNLFLLVKSILYDEHVSLSVNNKSGIGNLDISNITIRLLCIEVEAGKYKIFNFFSDNNLSCKATVDGKEVALSVYSYLKKEDFLTVSNINYLRIIESIIHAPKSKLQDELANILVLEMLKAYDEQKEKDLEILNSAQKIMMWLLERATIDLEILTVNKFQILKRMRPLLSDELQEISKIKYNTTDETILTAVSILLDSFVEAKLHYDRISEERRKEFDGYPITNLWTENK